MIVVSRSQQIEIPNQHCILMIFRNFVIRSTGIAGLLVVCGIGAYKFRRRGDMMTSMFLMQLRVAAQGAVVGTLSLGLLYTMASRYLFKSEPDHTKDNNGGGHR